MIVAVPNLRRIKVVSDGLEFGQCDRSMLPDSLGQFTDVVRWRASHDGLSSQDDKDYIWFHCHLLMLRSGG